MSAPPPLRIALAGLGTVGGAVAAALIADRALFAARAGRALDLVAIAARDRSPERTARFPGCRWWDDPAAMAAAAPVDIVIELIGGAEGAARATIERALAAGRHVVTANKALLAAHGDRLGAQAAAAGVALGFEAAVAGGVPIVKALREGLAANHLTRIVGILNGTCNFILTDMAGGGCDFADALADAQRLGYAEADPSFDIDGVDSAHKLAILAAIAFGGAIDLAAIHVEGIRDVSALDLAYAADLGYRVKLLALATLTDAGLEQRVHPCLVPQDNPIAQVDGVYNAVIAEGDKVGQSFYQGRGAGGAPTASAVIADLIDIARGVRIAAFATPDGAPRRHPAVPIERHVGPYYLRVMARDQPGVIADITAALRDQSVSLDAVLQRRHAPNGAVPVVLTTYRTDEAALRRAVDRIAALAAVVERPHVLRIMDGL